MSHTCHAKGCETPVRPALLMCSRHWFMLPRRIQRAVWSSYRVGQCEDGRPSRRWHTAASAAIGFVAMREDRGLTKTEGLALASFGCREEVIAYVMRRKGVSRARVEAEL